MSENENIEARLCSYVEGDLDPAGRADIEKYLLANPQYRPLIEELARTRGLLRKLPRESAPAELLETLSGQIERSALLGDDVGDVAGTRTNRLPHLAAWAAVLVLTGGLAAVIYRVLPSNKAQSELALLKPAPLPANVDLNSTSQSQKAELDQDQAQTAPAVAATTPAPAVDQQLAAAPTSQTLAEAPAATEPTIADAVTSAVGGGDSVAQTAVAGGTMAANANSALAGSIVGGDATQLGQNIYVTLRATDAKAADARVTQYLNDNGIAFESRLIDASAKLSAGPLAAPSMNYALPNSNAVPATPTMQPALASREREGAAHAFFQRTSEPSDSGSIIVARNLTTQQARQLTSDLDVRMSPAHLQSFAATQPIAIDQAPLVGAGPLQVGERVRVVARDNSVPGVEAMDEPQTIDADGNLTLPMVGKVKAAGLTAADLAEKIPEAYHNAKSPTTATWTIDRIATTSPATQPTLSLAALLNAAASTAPADTLVASTQPAMATDQGINVTIQVVGQSNATTAPATEPVLSSNASTQNVMPMIPTVAPAATMPTSAP
jgi:hypothetical protein